MSITPSPSEHPAPAPPTGEEVHLPGPTILPFVTAIGITFLVIGTTLGLVYSIVGGVVFVVAVARWIRDTRRDMAALPQRHEPPPR
jgi:hypothetical protein